MISGLVTATREIAIQLNVFATHGDSIVVTAIIDTGFNGELLVSSNLVESAGLRRDSVEVATLADGSEVACDCVQVPIDWDGQKKVVRALVANCVPLVGMKLLEGFRLVADVTEGGTVAIRQLDEFQQQ